MLDYISVQEAAEKWRLSRGMPYFPVCYFTADTGVGAGTWLFPAGSSANRSSSPLKPSE